MLTVAWFEMRSVKPILFCFLFLISCSPRKQKLQLEPGDYLSADYITRALATKSPLSADKSGTVQMYKLEKAKDGLHAMPIWNFHEGGDDVFIIGSTGDVQIPKSSPNAEIPKILSTHSRAFSIHWTKTPKATDGLVDDEYVWVGDAEKWLFQKLIAGSYRTKTGIPVTFRTEGVSQLPDGNGRYKMGLDHVLSDFDYIYDQHHSYGVRFDRGDLLLIDILESESGAEELASTVKWRLTPVSSQ